MTYMIVFMLLSAMFRSIEQICCNRPDRTWLPEWVYSGGGWLNIDGYHISSALHYWSMFFAGGFFILTDIALWWFPFIWFLYGNTFNLFYHVLFMKPEFMENFVFNFFRELFGKI